MAQREACGGKPVAIDDVYECDEVARNAQLEAFFQRIEEWFDALSKQLTALAVGSQPQNYHPNPCFVDEEEDLYIEHKGCDIKEDDKYIERVCLVDGILHQFMMTILKILVKEKRLSLIKIKSYTYEMSP